MAIYRKVTLILTASMLLFAADNPWTKVQELKSGSELRIFKKGAAQPVMATFDEANDERMVVVVKNKQMAVAKEDIDQVDARPPAKKTPRKLTVDHTVKTTEPDLAPHPNAGVPVPGTSYGSSLSTGGGSKPPFETVYRRTAK